MVYYSIQVFASSMVEGAGAYHVAKRLCDLEGRLPIDSVMSDSFQFWTTWRRQLTRLDSAAELTPQVDQQYPESAGNSLEYD